VKRWKAIPLFWIADYTLSVTSEIKPTSDLKMLVLFETAAGYAIFKVSHNISTPALQD
jgi:hypothetical protein